MASASAGSPALTSAVAATPAAPALTAPWSTDRRESSNRSRSARAGTGAVSSIRDMTIPFRGDDAVPSNPHQGWLAVGPVGAGNLKSRPAVIAHRSDQDHLYRFHRRANPIFSHAARTRVRAGDTGFPGPTTSLIPAMEESYCTFLDSLVPPASRLVRVPDRCLTELRERGYLVFEGFLGADELAAAQDALWLHYPRPEEYFADPPAHAWLATSQWAGEILRTVAVVEPEPTGLPPLLPTWPSASLVRPTCGSMRRSCGPSTPGPSTTTSATTATSSTTASSCRSALSRARRC